MREQDKTERQLLAELTELRQRIAELEAAETKRKRVEEALRRRNRELTVLNRASRALTSTLDLNRVLDTVLEEVRCLLDVTACSVWLIDSETDELVCLESAGPGGEIVQGWRLAPGQGLAGWVVRHGESLIVPDVRADKRYFEGVDEQIGLGLRSILAVPLQIRHHVIGVLQVLDTGVDRFGATDLEPLESLVASAAVAIENARLYQTAQQELIERRRTEEALRESEEKYRSLMEQSGEAIYVLYEGRFEVINPKFTELLGVTSEEANAPNFDFMTLVAPKSRPMIGERVKKLAEGQELSPRYEFTALDKDGNEIEVEVSVSYVSYRGGTATQGILRDITEHKRAERERERLLVRIQEQARQTQQIMDTVPEGVLLLDVAGCILLANPVAERSLAVLAGARAGDTLTRLGDRPLAELLTSPPRGLWHEVRAVNWIFEVIARPIETGPTASGWVLVIRDVTQEREIERRVQHQERLAAVGQLAAGIAHDFNNIMATILLYAEMTARVEGLSDRERERMATIKQQAQHASKLIQQILDFSRRAVLERQPLDLLSLLKEEAKLLGRTLPENIEIDLAYGSDEYTVNADPTRMQQMITNLAVNARDAMPEGGKLRIELERIQVRPGESPLLPEMKAGEWVKVAFSDTGTGIPPDVLPHIFEPFFTTKAPLGSGLGLAQVHGIVGQHEGRIDVETRVEEGTTFTIYLPALPALPVESPASKLSTPVEGRGETVLVVENEAAVRKALVEGLESLNYRVLEAVNGQEALALVEEHGDDSSTGSGQGGIALVLSDVVMPGMGGIALFHALRQKGSAVRVVLLTGHPMERELRELRTQGLNGWLLKPSSMERLAQVMARALDEEYE